MEIRKATRKKAKLRLGISAPSGAGKTYGALQLAFGIGGKIGLIDSENGSGDLYAHLGDYDIIQIQAPYTVKKYSAAVKAFEDAGYDVIIIDSLTHAWAGDGGLLDKQGKLADLGGNSYTAWRQVTPDHNALVEAMLQSPCHIIATMRSKTEYVLEENEKGKKTPKKVGMAPVQREGMEYEFTVMLDIDSKHVASASKDRTGLFDDVYFKLTTDTGKKLLAWLNDGLDPVIDEHARAKAAIEKANDEAALLKITGSEAYKRLLNKLDGRPEKTELVNLAANKVEKFLDYSAASNNATQTH
jgi:hypothetical protein